jgi:adenine-specific DNA-methyltransferase
MTSPIAAEVLSGGALSLGDVLPAVSALSRARRGATADDHRHALGQFFTPPDVAAFMASLLGGFGDRPIRILDPGAGTGILGVAAAHRLLLAGVPAVNLVAVELDEAVQPELARSIALLRSAFGPRFTAEVRAEDFLLLGRPTLGTAPLPADFDLAIANPPYFKMSPSAGPGGDAPNAYARFMEVAATALRPGGQLVCIVPRSYASGLYFKPFRRRFHSAMALERVHVFGSRRAAFAEDSVLQENIIVSYRRTPAWPSVVQVSASDSPASAASAVPRSVAASTVRDPADPASVLHLPVSDEDDATISVVRSWPATLRSLGLEISTGPVVAFRTDALVSAPGAAPTVPLLWMQHVQAGRVVWPALAGMRKPEHILASAGAALLLPNQTYVLLRRFSAKEDPRRLTVAVLPAGALPGSRIGLENHLNYIHRPGGELSLDEAYGLATLLDTSLVDRYFRISNGNTQVNATDMRALPLPAHDVICSLGATARRAGGGAADALVAACLGLPRS